MTADGALGAAFDELKTKTGIACRSMQEMADAINSLNPDVVDEMNLREKMVMSKLSFPKEIPELSFKVRTSKSKLRKMRRHMMGRKPRLPRKLKKAARHIDIRVLDVGQKADISTDPNNVIMQMDIDCSLRIIPAGYPRTRWVRRLIHLWRREMNQTYERFIKNIMQNNKEE